MNLTTIILSIIGFTALYSFISIVFERCLILFGLSRGNLWVLVVGAFIFVTLRILIDIGHPFDVYDLVLPLIGALGANRIDLTITIRKGRWWWLEDQKKL